MTFDAKQFGEEEDGDGAGGEEAGGPYEESTVITAGNASGRRKGGGGGKDGAGGVGAKAAKGGGGHGGGKGGGKGAGNGVGDKKGMDKVKKRRHQKEEKVKKASAKTIQAAVRAKQARVNAKKLDAAARLIGLHCKAHIAKKRRGGAGGAEGDEHDEAEAARRGRATHGRHGGHGEGHDKRVGEHADMELWHSVAGKQEDLGQFIRMDWGSYEDRHVPGGGHNAGHVHAKHSNGADRPPRWKNSGPRSGRYLTEGEAFGRHSNVRSKNRTDWVDATRARVDAPQHPQQPQRRRLTVTPEHSEGEPLMEYYSPPTPPQQPVTPPKNPHFLPTFPALPRNLGLPANPAIPAAHHPHAPSPRKERLVNGLGLSPRGGKGGAGHAGKRVGGADDVAWKGTIHSAWKQSGTLGAARMYDFGKWKKGMSPERERREERRGDERREEGRERRPPTLPKALPHIASAAQPQQTMQQQHASPRASRRRELPLTPEGARADLRARVEADRMRELRAMEIDWLPTERVLVAADRRFEHHADLNQELHSDPYHKPKAAPRQVMRIAKQGIVEHFPQPPRGTGGGGRARVQPAAAEGQIGGSHPPRHAHHQLDVRALLLREVARAEEAAAARAEEQRQAAQ